MPKKERCTRIPSLSATVDAQNLAINPFGLLACQEAYHWSYILGITATSEW
jgi:hypothetical protein